MQRVWLLNGKNITYDFDFTLWINEVVFSWIINWFDIVDVSWVKYIWPWKAIIEIVKTTWEKVLCGFENTENVEINITWTRKIFVKFDELKINDWSNNNTNWTWIAEIVYNETAFPTQNYFPLYSITSWVLTDLRVEIFLKSKKRKGFTPWTQRILLIDENWDESELAPWTNWQTIFCQDWTFYFDDIDIVLPIWNKTTLWIVQEAENTELTTPLTIENDKYITPFQATSILFDWVPKAGETYSKTIATTEYYIPWAWYETYWTYTIKKAWTYRFYIDIKTSGFLRIWVSKNWAFPVSQISINNDWIYHTYYQDVDCIAWDVITIMANFWSWSFYTWYVKNFFMKFDFPLSFVLNLI